MERSALGTTTAVVTLALLFPTTGSFSAELDTVAEFVTLPAVAGAITVMASGEVDPEAANEERNE